MVTHLHLQFNNASNCPVTKVRSKGFFSARGSCSTKWTLIWFFCRVHVRSLFSWWINNARMPWSCGPCPACEKGCICLFSDIHDPKGIRHQRPVNEKAFSDVQSLRSWIHLNQFGEKSFWHQGILQGRLIMITKDILGAAASLTSKVFSLNQH